MPPSIWPAASIGMNHAADFLQGDEIIDACLPGRRVDTDCRHVDRPCVRAVRITAIRLVVPVNAGRRLYCAPCAKRPVRADVLRHARVNASPVPPAPSSPASTKFLLQRERGGFHELADNHCGARRDRRPAVRHGGGVRLCDVDVVIVDPQRIGDDLREDRVGTLTDLGARRENAHPALGRRLDLDDGREVNFARSSKAGAVHERREADALA